MSDDRGIYDKYEVYRTDGKGIGRCIVLELRDPNTWAALLTWADTVEAAGNAQLAADVRRWVRFEGGGAMSDHDQPVVVGTDLVTALRAERERADLWKSRAAERTIKFRDLLYGRTLPAEEDRDRLRARLDAAYSVIQQQATDGWSWTRGVKDGPLWWVDNEGPRRLVTPAEAEAIRAALTDPQQADGER
jgi:hypothetical protein